MQKISEVIAVSVTSVLSNCQTYEKSAAALHKLMSYVRGPGKNPTGIQTQTLWPILPALYKLSHQAQWYGKNC